MHTRVAFAGLALAFASAAGCGLFNKTEEEPTLGGQVDDQVEKTLDYEKETKIPLGHPPRVELVFPPKVGSPGTIVLCKLLSNVAKEGPRPADGHVVQLGPPGVELKKTVLLHMALPELPAGQVYKAITAQDAARAWTVLSAARPIAGMIGDLPSSDPLWEIDVTGFGVWGMVAVAGVGPDAAADSPVDAAGDASGGDAGDGASGDGSSDGVDAAADKPDAGGDATGDAGDAKTDTSADAGADADAKG